MSLFQRIRTTVKADAHGVIDALEDRALLLRQCLRDAETELSRKRQQLEVALAELRAVEREEKATQGELSRFESDAQVALFAGNDELSRYALKAVLVRQARLRRNAQRREELERQRRELDRLLADQAERYEALRERVQAELSTGGSEGTFENVSDEQVELELMRRKAKEPVTP